MRKHRKSTTNDSDEQLASSSNNYVLDPASNNDSQESRNMSCMCEHLNEEKHSEFSSNVLFYIAGYIVSKLIKAIACSACKKSLLLLPKQLPDNGHDYTSTIYHEAGKASAFTTC